MYYFFSCKSNYLYQELLYTYYCNNDALWFLWFLRVRPICSQYVKPLVFVFLSRTVLSYVKSQSMKIFHCGIPAATRAYSTICRNRVCICGSRLFTNAYAVFTNIESRIVRKFGNLNPRWSVLISNCRLPPLRDGHHKIRLAAPC